MHNPCMTVNDNVTMQLNEHECNMYGNII